MLRVIVYLLALGLLFPPLVSAKQNSVTLQLKWDHEFQFAGYYAAVEQGYYAKHGLDVTIKSRVTPEGQLLNVFEEMKEERADFIVSGPDLIIGIREGLQAKIIATISQMSPYVFVTRKGEFGSPAEFAGKRVNLTEPYWGPVELAAMVKNAGGKVDSFAISNMPPSLELLTNNQADIVATYWESAAWQMKEMNQEFDIFRAVDYGIYLYGDTLLASEDIIARDPKLVEAFTAASLEGWKYAFEHSDEVSQMIADKYVRVFNWYKDFAAYNRFQAQHMKRIALYPTVALGHTSVDRWQKTVRYFEEANFVPAGLMAEKFIYQPAVTNEEMVRKVTYVLVTALGLAAVLMLATLFWNRSLRNRITEKTEDLRALNNSLELKVVQRTKDLEAAKEAALLSAKSKSSFVTNVSHELRTPLNAIIGLSGLALRSADPVRQKDALSKVNASANSLLNIINDILDFSKIEAGKLEVESHPFLWPEFIATLNDICLFSAQSQGIEFVLSGDKDVPQGLMADASRLKQVLLNLIGNAIKFTHVGRVSVEVTWLPAATKGESSRLAFVIQDTGIGVSPELAEKLFEPFEQADSSIARRFGGTGLGLAISRSLVNRLGGEIELDRSYAGGARFKFWVQANALKPEQLKILSASKLSHNTIPQFEGVTALIIEDQPLNREVIRGVLEECGIACDEVDSGLAGLEKLLTKSYDCVFLDIQLPGIDGFETLKRIRANSDFKKLMVIAMTAHAQEGYKEFCLAQGFTSYLAKPIELHAVYALLERRFVTRSYKSTPGLSEVKGKKEEVNSGTKGVKDREPPKEKSGKTYNAELIDVESGVKRLRGKPERYRTLLMDFIQHKPTVVERISELVGRNKMTEAAAYAHEIKGASGNLALYGLHYCLTDLEDAIAINDLPALHQKLVDLGRIWRVTHREILRYLGSGTGSGSGSI